MVISLSPIGHSATGQRAMIGDPGSDLENMAVNWIIHLEAAGWAGLVEGQSWASQGWKEEESGPAMGSDPSLVGHDF
jgi:hypothetical protein